MAADIETFKAMFPEFCVLGDKTIEIWLAESVDYLDPDTWGDDCIDRACLYLTGHELALVAQRLDTELGANAGGVVQSAGAGGMSVSYAVPAFATQGTIDEAIYARTPYGLKYLQLRENCLGGGRLAGTREATASQQIFRS